MRESTKFRTAEMSRAVSLALARMPTVAPTSAELAEALEVPASVLAADLAELEGRGIVETWRDGAAVRVLLAAGIASRLGLILAPAGDRWLSTRRV